MQVIAFLSVARSFCFHHRVLAETSLLKADAQTSSSNNKQHSHADARFRLHAWIALSCVRLRTLTRLCSVVPAPLPSDPTHCSTSLQQQQQQQQQRASNPSKRQPQLYVCSHTHTHRHARQREWKQYTRTRIRMEGSTLSTPHRCLSLSLSPGESAVLSYCHSYSHTQLQRSHTVCAHPLHCNRYIRGN